MASMKTSASLEAAPKVQWPCLHFADVRVERGFVDSRCSNLAYCAFICSMLAVFLLLGMLCLDIWYIIKDTRAELSSFRIFICTVPLLIMYLWLMLTSRSELFLKRLGAVGLERLTVVIITFTACFLVLYQPGYLSKVAPDMAPIHWDYDLVVDDTNLLLLLDCLITGTHMFLPIRWSTLWCTDLAAIVCFVVPTLLWGTSPVLVIVTHLLFFPLLVVGSSLGKCVMEQLQRKAFAQIAAEKTARCEAEFQLCNLEEDSVKKTTSLLSQVGRELRKAGSMPPSDVPTSLTGELFSNFGKEAVTPSQAAWETLVELAYVEHWLVELRDLQIQPENILGSGGFGLVIQATYHGASVALKACRVTSESLTLEHLKTMVHEIRVLRHVRHPNIVLWYGAVIEWANHEILLVMECLRGIHLDSFVGVPPAKPSTLERVSVAYQVSSALRYLHAQRPAVVHGDIKDSNIVVERLQVGLSVKLVDFGLSRLITKRAKHMGGTLRWAAPEVILGARPATSADAFSFGRLAYMIFTGLKPLLGSRRVDIIALAQRLEPVPMEWPEHVTGKVEAQALAESCMHKDIGERANMDQVQSMVSEWMATLTNDREVIAADRGTQAPDEPQVRMAKALQEARDSVNSLMVPVLGDYPVLANIPEGIQTEEEVVTPSSSGQGGRQSALVEWLCPDCGASDVPTADPAKAECEICGYQAFPRSQGDVRRMAAL